MASSRKVAPDLLGAVELTLNACLNQGSRLAVGYSGGLDSSALLHMLARLRERIAFSLTAVHVHHGLSPQADAWAAHCQRVCGELGVPLVLVRVDVMKRGQGLEAAARLARYRVYSRLEVDFVALAHHRDDQAETVLLQFLRGADLKGLAAMPMARAIDHSQVKLLRPLLAFSRAELAAYASAAGLHWVEDASNADIHLTRNALRHDILPTLEQHLPGSGAALARSAVQFAEYAGLIDALAVLDGEGALANGSLAVDRLAGLPEPRARNLLRYFLGRAGGKLRRDALQEALRQLLRARGDARLQIDFGPVSLGRFQGRAWVVPNRVMAPPVLMAWRGEANIDLGQAGQLEFRRGVGAGIRLGGGSVSIRQRQGGERLQLVPGRPVRTLKNLLREAGVPPWRRDELPLLFVGQRLVWAAVVGPDASCRVGAEEEGWLISWRQPW